MNNDTNFPNRRQTDESGGIVNPNASPGIGYLIVNTRTARGALPVEGASVLVSTNEDFGENGVLYTLRTNASGATEKVSLSAPPMAESMKPGAEKPYATYNLRITKEGYQTVEKINVPIFENLTAIQPVELVPLAEYQQQGEAERFNEIPPQNPLL